MYFKQYLRTPAHLPVKKMSLPKSAAPENKSLQSASVAQYETVIV